MDKKLIALIAAAVLAVLGVGAVALYAKGANDRAFDSASLEQVLVVTAPVPSGAQAQKLAGSVELKALPKVAIAEGAVTELSALGDTVANGPLSPGEQVTSGRFSSAEAAGLTVDLPKGMQELEITLTAPRVPTTVKDGSTVGFLVSYPDPTGTGETRLALSKIKVIKVDRATVGGDNGGEGTLLRLAVTTEQAQQIANAMEFGKVWVTNQNEGTDVRSGGAVDAKGVIG